MPTMPKLAFSLIISLVIPTVSSAFPENIRLGYAGCGSCHISPSGGGVLNNYGRAAPAEFMTSFAYKDEGRFLHNAIKKSFDAVDVGGDVRYIKVEYQPKGGEPFKRAFLMQADFELALHLSPELTVVALYGKYGEEEVREFRRHYILWSPSEMFSFRYGRFYPAYGILGADHTLAVRKHLGFGQGQETYNAEASLHGEKGEVFLTGILGKEASVRLTNDQGYQVSSEEKGVAARAAYFWSDRAQVGGSAMLLQNENGSSTRVVGLFLAAAANEKLYAMAQYDIKTALASEYADPVVTSAGYYKLGWQIFRGIHLYGQAENTKSVTANNVSSGGGAQWFPRPHIELLGQYMSSETSKTTYLMAHYYW